MLGHEVDEGLETGAATSFDLDVLRGFEERLHFAQIDVKLHDVDLFDAVFEETVDGGVEVLEVILSDAATAIHTNDQPCGEIVATAHGVEAKATVGAHTCELALLRENSGAEACQNLTVVDAGLGGGDDFLYQFPRHGAPSFHVADGFVDLGVHEFVLLPVGSGYFDGSTKSHRR